MSDPGYLVTVGKPTPFPLYDIPGLSWDIEANRLVFMVPADDLALVTAVHEDGDLTLGLSSAGPIPVLMARLRDGRGRALGYWEAPGPWRPGREAPEVRIGQGDRILWAWITAAASEGYERTGQGDPGPRTVLGLRACTTSPAFTRTLRRLQSEQRAHGPMDEAEVAARMADHYGRTDSGGSAWRRCLVTSKAGE